jgi:hypothetical protein
MKHSHRGDKLVAAVDATSGKAPNDLLHGVSALRRRLAGLPGR